MNRKILRTIGTAAVVGICAAFMYAPSSLAASDDEKLQMEMAEKMYIGEVSQYCQKVLFGENGIPDWNERNGKAYKSCLREYGVLFSYSAKDRKYDDHGSPENYGHDDSEQEPVDMNKEILEAESGIAKAEKSATKERSDYRLTDKGREAVAARLEEQGLGSAYRRSNGGRGTERSSEKKKGDSKPPAYIYKKPKSEEDAPSRVFQGYQ